MTWSPFLRLVTPGPTSTTMPAPSCPRIAGNSPSGSAPGQRVGVGMADAGRLDLDQHLARFRPVEPHGLDRQRLFRPCGRRRRAFPSQNHPRQKIRAGQIEPFERGGQRVVCASPGDPAVQPEVTHFTAMAESAANLQPAFARKLIKPWAGGILAPSIPIRRLPRLRMSPTRYSHAIVSFLPPICADAGSPPSDRSASTCPRPWKTRSGAASKKSSIWHHGNLAMKIRIETLWLS